MRRAALAGAAVLAAVTAGSFVRVEASTTSALPAGCDRSWPVVAYHPGGQAVAVPSLPVACGRPTGYATSETGIAVADGALVFSPASTENAVARSTDAGVTWSLSRPSVEQPTAFWNTVDPWLVADPRTGRLFWSHAAGPVRDEGGLPDGSGFWLAAAQGFQVYTSADGGRSWTTASYTDQPTGDWDKVMVGPPPAGQPQPHGYPDVVYFCANAPFEVTGPGRLCYRSRDGARTFQLAGYLQGGVDMPDEVCPPLDFNAGVVAGDGTLYQPFTCNDGGYISISRDEGSSYSWVRVPGAPGGGAVGGNLLQLAVDRADDLYAMWTSGGRLYLTISRDGARTWSRPQVVSAPGVTDVVLPAISAGTQGRVGLTYYASTTPDASMLDAYVTETADALAPDPVWYSGVANDPAHPIFHEYGLSDSPRADYIGAAFDAAGDTFWAGLVEQLGPPDSSGHIATTGYVARLVGGA